MPYLNPGVLSVDFSFRGAFSPGGFVDELARDRTSIRGRSVFAAEGGRDCVSAFMLYSTRLFTRAVFYAFGAVCAAVSRRAFLAALEIIGFQSYQLLGHR